MPSPSPLQPGLFYHIFNRGTNGENLFLEERNYRYFMELYAHHIEPVAATYAYCLLKNHFHLLVRIYTVEEQTLKVSGDPGDRTTFRVLEPSQQFSNLFNAYTKAINKACQRTGSLFEHPFHRIPVTSLTHYTALIRYIHRNPQKHGFTDDFRDWPFSSYAAMISNKPSRLQRDQVLEWFGGRKGLEASHQCEDDLSVVQQLALETP